MGFNNVPVNGWPQIKDLERLNELAQKIDGMSTLTSSDRDWLDEWESKLPELPEDPESDGVKVLTATTDDGETVKSWEDPANGLPEDPVADGTNILQAVTSSGETSKSWSPLTDFFVKNGSVTGDCNSLQNNGMYRLRENSTNMPTGVSDGMLIVFVPSSDNVTFQIIISSEGKAWCRMNWYGTWGSWKVMAS